MKLSTLAIIGVGVGSFLFAWAIETEMEYMDVAIAGVVFLGLILLWIGTLMIDLNAHFEELEEESDEQE